MNVLSTIYIRVFKKENIGYKLTAEKYVLRPQNQCMVTISSRNKWTIMCIYMNISLILIIFVNLLACIAENVQGVCFWYIYMLFAI